jgi:hypothetical protein
MSTNFQEQEIDLGQLSKKMKGLFNKLVNNIFDLIFFIKKKIVVIIFLMIIGLVAAYIIDGKKTYNHEISVIPNFGSSEFLYKRIEEINTKIREKDSVFFKKLGITNSKDILEIEIEAFPGVFEFINSGEEGMNFKMIELMADDGDLEKIISSETTSRNFFRHKISIKTNGMWEKDKLISPILNYLNDNTYFTLQQKLHQANVKEKIIKNDSLTNQIDRVINQLSSKSNSGGNISISEGSSIYDLIDKKDKLVYNSQQLKGNEIIFDKIIKDESSIINMRDYKPLLLNLKIVFPFLLIFIYLISFTLKKTIQKQKIRIAAKDQ